MAERSQTILDKKSLDQFKFVIPIIDNESSKHCICCQYEYLLNFLKTVYHLVMAYTYTPAACWRILPGSNGDKSMAIVPQSPRSGKKTPKVNDAAAPAEPPRRIRLRPVIPGEPDLPDAQPKISADPNRNPDGTYKVGKYKTPEHTRWKPGQSGNPSGPKKMKKDLGEIVIDTMEQMIALTSAQGRKVRMTQGSALMRKLYEQAVKGNLKATVFLLDLYAKALDRRSAGGTPDDGLTAAEQEMLQNLFRGFGGDAPEGAPA